MDSGSAEFAGCLEAELRFGTGLRRRCGRHRAEPTEHAPGCWNNRWVPSSWLLIDADLAWTHARFSDNDPAGKRIPNAVDKVASIAVTARDLGPWSASLQWRYLGSGALIEDDSVRSHDASLTANIRVTRTLGRVLGSHSELALDVFNLFNRRVNDIEYFYASQLHGESAPVSDQHVHAAEPRTVRVTLRVGFEWSPPFDAGRRSDSEALGDVMTSLTIFG